jgi:hypothetical protein
MFERGRSHKRTIERDARLEVRIVGRIEPHCATATAEAHDAKAIAVTALRLRPCNRSVEIGEQLGVRLGVDDRQQIRDFGNLRELDALSEIVVWRDGERAEMAQPARDVLDVFV